MQPNPAPPLSYDPGPLSRGRWIALSGALLGMAGIFLLVPATHWLNPDDGKRALTQRPVEVVRQPPPPPLAADMREQSPQASDIPLPAVTENPAELPLQSLNIPLQPGYGDAMAAAFAPPGFAVTADAAADMAIFQVSELDRIPRVISSPGLFLPPELAREGIGGRVRLEVIIHPNGGVEVVDVISADHPRLVRHARRFAEQCVFEPPTRGGRRVAAHYEFPISY